MELEQAYNEGWCEEINSFEFGKTPRISLSCKLVPVQYWEYKYGLLACNPGLYLAKRIGKRWKRKAS